MAERREFVRIDTQLPFRYRILNAAEYRREKARILTDTQDREDPLRQLMERWAAQEKQGMRGGELERLIVPVLATMHEKLDRILFLLNPHDPVALRFDEPLPVNISGSGLGFSVKEPLPPDTMLALDLLLPLAFPLAIKAVGKVSRVQPLNGAQQHWYMGVRFDVIREADREAIIRHVFREQRIALRARSTSPLAATMESTSAL